VIKITLKTSSVKIPLVIPKISINPDLCTGCGVCGEVCPFGLPQPNEDGKYEIFGPERCTECSACKRNCPTMAVVLQERKGCGCLWNARAVAKNPQINNCCG
jgi:ferredoxin